jgi:hypothetical protein
MMLPALGNCNAPPAPYQPLAFLVGHCWQGTFPDGKATDGHCFSWIYGSKFVRDEHVVHSGDGHPDGSVSVHRERIAVAGSRRVGMPTTS